MLGAAGCLCWRPLGYLRGALSRLLASRCSRLPPSRSLPEPERRGALSRSRLELLPPPAKKSAAASRGPFLASVGEPFFPLPPLPLPRLENISSTLSPFLRAFIDENSCPSLATRRDLPELKTFPMDSAAASAFCFSYSSREMFFSPSASASASSSAPSPASSVASGFSTLGSVPSTGASPSTLPRLCSAALTAPSSSAPRLRAAFADCSAARASFLSLP
mmetsp:Transcript_6184/g.18657  ORF Transcript_6184/g.18657 Transcript_6184/m.18657 type:complete len:220 (+) Transcript_6184:336-995(+)